MIESAPGPSRHRAVALLAAQAFALGLVLAWTTIPAGAIFLDSYGADALPYTYIGAAVAGAVASAALARAYRRRSLVWVTKRVLAALAVLLAASSVGLRAFGPWVSIPLLVLIPIMVPVGFMFVVGQAGALLDVRELKRFYARVIAGFALGVVIGGLVGPALIELAGHTETLLAFAAGVASVFLLLVSATERSFPARLARTDDAPAEAVRPTIHALLRNRYVACLVAFQMLSAVESQWLDFLVFDRAAQRYTSSTGLADFISLFSAVAYGADILFLLLVAGILLRRFGLRYGLTVNAIAVLALVLATIAFGAFVGSGATIVFVLVVAARVTDLTLSDGATRTSLGAAYQAVAPAERLAAQATVEGLAVPVAIGASGVVLLVLRATVGTSGLALPVLTSFVVIAWIAVAVALFRGYRVNLLTNLRRRVLDPSTLEFDDVNTATAIDRLLDSDDERDVRLGLDTLAASADGTFRARLISAGADDRPGVRLHALGHLVAVDPEAAAAAARPGLAHADAAIRAASLRALAIAGVTADTTAVRDRWADPHDDVRVAAAAAICALGGDDGRRLVSAQVLELSRGANAHGPVLAARVLASCDPDDGIDRSPLHGLVIHPDLAVAEIALGAVRWPHDADLLVDIVAHLEVRPTSAAAVDALVRGGHTALDVIDEALSGAYGLTRRGQCLLARVCRMIGGAEATLVLQRHLAHRDREVGLAVAVALAELSSPGSASRSGATSDALIVADDDVERVLRQDLVDATHALRALCELGTDAHLAVLCRAVEDELQLLQRRILAFLSIRHGYDAMNRVALQLALPDGRSHGLALEWLDVTLAGIERSFLALVEPGWSPEQRARSLARQFPLDHCTADDVLHDLFDDPDDRWRRPWIRACALLVAVQRGTIPLDDGSIDRARLVAGADDESIVHETVAQLLRRRQG